jgi:hypothetical protein
MSFGFKGLNHLCTATVTVDTFKTELTFCSHSYLYSFLFASFNFSVCLFAGNGQPTHLYAEDAQSSSEQSHNLMA